MWDIVIELAKVQSPLGPPGLILGQGKNVHMMVFFTHTCKGRFIKGRFH